MRGILPGTTSKARRTGRLCVFLAMRVYCTPAAGDVNGAGRFCARGVVVPSGDTSIYNYSRYEHS